jgi:hypothetical protein
MAWPYHHAVPEAVNGGPLYWKAPVAVTEPGAY